MISHLADVPFFLDELACLHVAEWGNLYSGWGVEDVRAEFLGQRADGSLPATLVLHEGMDLAGAWTRLGVDSSWDRACGRCGGEAASCLYRIRRVSL